MFWITEGRNEMKVAKGKYKERWESFNRWLDNKETRSRSSYTRGFFFIITNGVVAFIFLPFFLWPMLIFKESNRRLAKVDRVIATTLMTLGLLFLTALYLAVYTVLLSLTPFLNLGGS